MLSDGTFISVSSFEALQAMNKIKPAKLDIKNQTISTILNLVDNSIGMQLSSLDNDIRDRLSGETRSNQYLDWNELLRVRDRLKTINCQNSIDWIDSYLTHGNHINSTEPNKFQSIFNGTQFEVEKIFVSELRLTDVYSSSLASLFLNIGERIGESRKTIPFLQMKSQYGKSALDMKARHFFCGLLECNLHSTVVMDHKPQKGARYTYTNKELLSSRKSMEVDPFHCGFRKNQSGTGLLMFKPDQTIQRKIANGSLLLNVGTGSIVIHIYEDEQSVLCPIYCNSISQFQGFLYLDKSNRRVDAILGRKSCYKHFASAGNFIKYLVSVLNKYSLHSSGETISNTVNVQRALVFGQRNSYGHMIINDMRYLSYLFGQHKHSDLVIAGRSDFLDSIQLVKQSGADLVANITPLESYDSGDQKAYIFRDLFLYMLPTLRVDEEALGLIKARLNEVPTHSKSIAAYFLVDTRRNHGRGCLNTIEVFKCYCSNLSKRGISTLLIDGETALPRYSKIQGGNGITVNSYTEQNKEEAKIIDQLVVIASSYTIKLVIVASKPFTRKIDIFKNYSIALGLCNYGSGMATPVYILNTTMFLCGYDSIDKTTYKHWAWHYDSYCHKERKEDAIRVRVVICQIWVFLYL